MDKKSKSRLFEQYDKLSINISDEDFEMAREFIVDLGLDADEIAEEGMKESKRLIFLAKAKVHQQKDEALLERISSKLKGLIQKNKNIASEILFKNLTSSQTSFQFRNLEKWSDDQMREVLNDVDLIKLMEELEELDDE